MNGLENRKYTAYYRYDFAKDGGAIGDIALRGPYLPAGAVVHDGLLDVQTGLTGGALAEAALTLAGAGDLIASGVMAGYAAGLVALVPVGSAATAIKLTAAKKPVMTVSVAALTAGKFVLAVEYYITTE